MKSLLIAAVLALAVPSLAVPSLTFAQTPVVHAQLIPDDGPAAPSLIACSYNEAGDFTGSDGANPGEQAGDPVKTGQGGDTAWRQVIAAPDGRSCAPHIQTK